MREGKMTMAWANEGITEMEKATFSMGKLMEDGVSMPNVTLEDVYQYKCEGTIKDKHIIGQDCSGDGCLRGYGFGI
jgi:hypothetical protein